MKMLTLLYLTLLPTMENRIGGYLRTYCLVELSRSFRTFLPPVLNQDDEFKWGATPDGSFATKSAYLSHLNTNPISINSVFSLIWKWKGNERIRILLWKLGHGNLLTNVERQRRMMSPTATFPICGVADETLLHRFRDCQTSLAFLDWFQCEKIEHFYGNLNW